MNERHRILRLIALLSGHPNYSDEEIFERFEKAYDKLWNSSESDIRKINQDLLPDGKLTADDFLLILASWLLPSDTPPS